MAVVSVHEQFQQRRSTFRDNKMVHVRQWIVRCDDPADGTAVAVVADDGDRAIPKSGDPHDRDGSATLTGLEAVPQQNSDVIFVVQGEYTSTGFGSTPISPLLRPPEISYGSAEVTEPYFVDKSDTPKLVTTSAGDPFQQFTERENGDFVLTITVNEATFNPVEMDAVKHTVNADDVYIDGTTYGAGTLKLSLPTATKATERVQADGPGGAWADFTYYKVTYTVKVRKEGWDDKVLDAGLNEYIPDPDPTKPGKVTPIMNGVTLAVSEPWPLDGAGRKKPNKTDHPAELTFKPYGRLSWSDLKAFKSETWGKTPDEGL